MGSVRPGRGDQRCPEDREQRREGPVQRPRTRALQVPSHSHPWERASSPEISEEGKLRQGATGRKETEGRVGDGEEHADAGSPERGRLPRLDRRFWFKFRF